MSREGQANGASIYKAQSADGNTEISTAKRSLDNYSDLQLARLQYTPSLPTTCEGSISLEFSETIAAGPYHDRLSASFPNLHRVPAVRLTSYKQGEAVQTSQLRIGIVLSGGQAPGGHNVIAGLYDHLQSRHPGSSLLGFLNGPRGITTAKYRELTKADMDLYRNQGGFNMIGSGRDKIESQEDLQKAANTAKELQLDGLVVIGGDDSNTNAAVLAEYFLSQGLSTSVIGAPKTIDGDLKSSSVPISFGFDTASKVYSEMIGNIMIDAASAGKYWHWIRLMGRAASHITLECALQTHPQAALISEEISAQRLGLADIVKQLADIVENRGNQGLNYGVVLLPEGLIEYVPEVGTLIAEINEILARTADTSHSSISQHLSPTSQQVFELLPVGLKEQLLLDRDPHGNVQVAKIETERLLLDLVSIEIARRKQAGSFTGKFNGMTHYMGYEGRASLPTNFDATYCYSLGHAAGALLGAKQTGLMACANSLHLPSKQWELGGVPLVSMMTIERRKGKDKPVIEKALVKLDGAPFKAFASKREQWALHDCFRSPGPIQFYGGGSADVATLTLALEINKGQEIQI